CARARAVIITYFDSW
nr:immunoglobulin heavy chain junction region [Macaca mulatta]